MNEVASATSESVEALVSQVTDEFMAQLAGGERPEIEAYASRHPQIAMVLRELLPALQVLRAPPADAAAPASTHEAKGCLGDYRILREVGRGGMGVVYEAEQLSLGRRVALKVLPFAAALDAKQLQRFKNEAQAAAHLHHQNIVPVYSVGCERGVPYYSMQFIDGRTLAKVIADLRWQRADWRKQAGPGHEFPGEPPTQDLPSPIGHLPSANTNTPPVAALATEQSTQTPAFFRTAANLGVQAAKGLEHAHELGVVHRDIKPANLLVDLRGNLWITDFGLAHCQSQAGPTMTGDLVGTLRYMSPEQALAQRVAIDHRTDIYSLGVSLYELLTLEPVFDGRDRHELLRQVAFDEPRPPRRLNKAIPEELETIVLKAMEKNPIERYASAQELADDLERFLKDEPIRAKRPTVPQRARKWLRRHRPVALTAGLAAVGLLLMALAGLAVSNTLLTREKKQTDDALRAETHARVELSHALDRERRSVYFERIARVEREWAANNLNQVEQLLDACPAELRGWEWHYLRRLRLGNVSVLRHASPGQCVAFSPDGERLASGNLEGVVKVWDLRNGREIASWRAHGDQVYGLAFRPDGRALASASLDETVKVWETATWKQRLTFHGHPGGVCSVAFSPDGSQLASAGFDKLVKTWDATTGREVLSLSGHTDGVFRLALSGDGRRLASASMDGTVKVWDLSTGREVLTFSGHGQMVRDIAFSPDGRRLASASGTIWKSDDGLVKVWDTATGKERFTLRGHVGEVSCVAFSPDGRRIASGGADQTLRLWDVATGQEALALHGHADLLFSLAFSPDGRRLASTSLDQTVRIWDARPLDQKSGQEELTLHAPSNAVLRGVAFSPDGRRLASAGEDRTVRVWDVQTWQELFSLRGHTDAVAGVAFSPEGRRVASASGKELMIWNAVSGQEILTIPDAARLVVFDPEGKRLAAAGGSDVGRGFAIKIWDAATGKELYTLRGHTSLVLAVAFSPDGRHLASASSDLTVRLWDAKSGRMIRTLTGHAGRVCGVAFSPDSRRLASASLDRTVRVWDVATGKELFALRDPTGGALGVAFGPDNKRIAWTGTDATVKVWDGEPGSELSVLRGHTRWVFGVAFSPDGQLLASASADGSVKIWTTPRGVSAPRE
jgi:WD40 repeat protein/serine/threonine protein kinase